MKPLIYNIKYVAIAYFSFASDVSFARMPPQCSWVEGSPTGSTSYIKVDRSYFNAINNGNYPRLVEDTTANFSDTAYSDPNKIAFRCIAPVEVRIDNIAMLRTQQKPAFGGYPNMYTTALPRDSYAYGYQMFYPSPAGRLEPVYGGANFQTFKVASRATPLNPVIVTARDLNLDKMIFKGYQVGDVRGTAATWNRVGGLVQFKIYLNDVETGIDFRYYLEGITPTMGTCVISNKDKEKQVYLGNVKPQDFSDSRVGGVTSPVRFQISLECIKDQQVTYKIYSPYVDNTNDPTNTLGLLSLIQNSNTAKGFAIQLRAAPFGINNNSYSPVKFNMPSLSSFKSKGNPQDDELKFDARYYRTLNAADAKGGTANSSALIDVNYQ